jgi:phage gpG-like protein
VTVSVAGDFAGLQAIAGKLAAMPEHLPALAKAIGDEAIDLVKQGFADRTDPYGAQWADKADGSACFLVGPTGNLKDGWHTKEISASQVVIGPAVYYGAFHQGGTRKMKARKMVPDDGNIPATWEATIEEAATEMIRELLS